MKPNILDQPLPPLSAELFAGHRNPTVSRLPAMPIDNWPAKPLDPVFLEGLESHLKSLVEKYQP